MLQPSPHRAADRGAQALLALALAGLPIALGCTDASSPADLAEQDTVAAGSGAAGSVASGSPVTWTADVAPIVFRRCAPCHRPGEVAPFSLLGYAEARRRAKQIVEVTASRYMPPWKPEPGHGEFIGSRALSASEIAVFARWVDFGAPEGAAGDLPPLPEFAEGWQLGEPDLVVAMPETYEIAADQGVDVFRNFVVPVHLDRRRYVRAVEFRPDNRRVVHHAQVLVDADGNARQLDDLDPLPGYSGMVSAASPGGHFIGWTPGRVVRELDPDLVWELDPGTDLVLETHLLPTGKPERLRCSVGLYFADRPPAKRPASIHLGASTIDIAAGAADYRVSDVFEVPVAVDAVSVYPHAHYLGKELRSWAILPGGERLELLWIRDWDFNWQDEYAYAMPVHLPAGTRVHLEVAYDNTAANVRNPHDPPQRVIWGPRSSDEMGDLWLKVIPRDPDRLLELRRAIYRKDVVLAKTGYEFTLTERPDDFEANSLLGYILLREGNAAGSIRYLRSALRQSPGAWQVHFNLGGALLQSGDSAGAIAQYRDAVETRPGYAEAHGNLAVALAQSGRVSEAIAEYQAATELRPGHAPTHNNFGVLLTRLDRFDDSIRQFEAALTSDSTYSPALKNLANSLARQGRVAESVASLERLVELTPDDLESRHFLALGLAQLGRLEEAVRHLELVVERAPQDAGARSDLLLLRRESEGRKRGS